MTYVCHKINAVTEPAKFDYVDLSKQEELGVALMDDEQRQLIYLSTNMGDKEGQVGVMTVLALLRDYAKNHFQDEEAQMAESNYPKYEVHRRMHQEFRDMLTALLRRVRMMTLDELSNAVRNLINGWLYHHIIMVDFDYISPSPMPRQDSQLLRCC